MTTNIDRAADVIAGCWPNGRGVRKDDAIVLARALADAGLRVLDLPEPRMIGRRGPLGGLRAEWGIGFDTVIADGPNVRAGRYLHPLTPEQARDLGYALLAAADHAEEVGTDEA